MSDIVERLENMWMEQEPKLLWTDMEAITEEAADEITRLRAENERLEDTRIEFIGIINKLIDERVKMRKALNPFAYYASQIPDDVSDTASASGTVGDLRAAAAAIRDTE